METKKRRGVVEVGGGGGKFGLLKTKEKERSFTDGTGIRLDTRVGDTKTVKKHGRERNRKNFQRLSLGGGGQKKKSGGNCWEYALGGGWFSLERMYGPNPRTSKGGGGHQE